jgi:hypothetical protein
MRLHLNIFASGVSHFRATFSPCRVVMGFLVALMALGSALLLDFHPEFDAAHHPGGNLAHLAPSGGARSDGGGNIAGLPLSFEENRGQADSSYRFLVHGGGYTLFLADQGAVLEVRSDSNRAGRNAKSNVAKRGVTDEPRAVALGPASAARFRDHHAGTAATLRLRLLGSKVVRPTGIDPLPGRVNYYIGNDPAKWYQNVATYAKVKYHDIYPGVDLVYHGQRGQLEYDFVVAPGADPSSLLLAVDAAGQESSRRKAAGDRLKIDSNGDLVVPVGGAGDVRFRRPIVYQEGDPEVQGPKSVAHDNLRNSEIDHRQFRKGHYVLDAHRHVRFALGPYDHTKPLVIDPALVYSVGPVAGGAGYPSGIGVDGSGNAYVVGPASSPEQIYVIGLNPQGNAYLYTTHLGGSRDLYYLHEPAIAVDSQGDAYIAGAAGPSLPTTPGAYLTTCGNDCPTAFVAKLSPSGSLVYSTYLGGKNSQAYAIAADSSGKAYVTGTADSSVPMVNAFMTSPDAGPFAVKVNPAGTGVVYSTYLGGGGRGIAVDGAGSAYVVGPGGPNTPIKNALEPAMYGSPVLMKLTPDGSALVYSTFLGGSGGTAYGEANDSAVGVAVDAAGNAYVTGAAVSLDFPFTLNAFRVSCTEAATETCQSPGIYALEVSADGRSLIYSTLIGTGTPGAIAVDTSGYAWVVGTTTSNYYPVAQAVESSLQQMAYPRSNQNATVSRLDPNGMLTFSTYLGGSLGSSSGAGVAVDSNNNAYVTGHGDVSDCNACDFPVTYILP